MPATPPSEVEAILAELKRLLNVEVAGHGRVGGCPHGVYAFFDYDDEPIYVGQTREGLSTRIRRHLTNQRTDAVAMNVLDVFEVSEVALYPFWDLEGLPLPHIKDALDAAEYTLYAQLLEESVHGAILNEKVPEPCDPIVLPEPVRRRIVPPEVFNRRVHSDLRISRRAQTIARLAQVISERRVQPGLRHTLLVQARRLEALARRRYDEP